MNALFKVCLWGRALLPEVGLACPQASCWKIWAPSTGWKGGGPSACARSCPSMSLSAGRRELVGQGWRTAAGAQGPPTCYQPASGGQTQGKRVASRQKLLARCFFTEPCPKWVPLDGEQPSWLAQDRRVPRSPADRHATVTYSPEVSGAPPEARSEECRWGLGIRMPLPPRRGRGEASFIEAQSILTTQRAYPRREGVSVPACACIGRASGLACV